LLLDYSHNEAYIKLLLHLMDILFTKILLKLYIRLQSLSHKNSRVLSICDNENYNIYDLWWLLASFVECNVMTSPDFPICILKVKSLPEN